MVDGAQDESTETIAQTITPPGRGAVALVRVSGPLVTAIAEKLLSRAREVLEAPRLAVVGPLLDSSGEILDHAVATYFRAPRSYTGEDCLELGVHGSPFIVRRLLGSLQDLGARLARGGEFSERAFLNGKLDLSQVEGVADLIAAETEVQARVAREQLEGKLSRAISDLGEPLRNLLAEIEAYIDFPEEDIQPLTRDGWRAELGNLMEAVAGYTDSFERGRLSREGALIVLAGLPNAGKSSLLNRLLGEERAIVTPVPGTTRDSIEELASLNGYAVRLCDTAGLLDEDDGRVPDEVEALGIERSWRKLEAADLVLYVVDASGAFEQQFRRGGVYERITSKARDVLIVCNKSDLTAEELVHARLGEPITGGPEGPAFVSAMTGEGLRGLRERIAEQVFTAQSAGGSVVITNERHHRALLDCSLELAQAVQVIESGEPSEIIAFHLRAALTAMSDIIGVTYTDDILGRIFSKFCIGK